MNGDRTTILGEGIRSEFFKILCEALIKRIESAKNELEQQSNIDRIKFLQYDIKVCREFLNLPQILMKHAQGAKKEGE